MIKNRFDYLTLIGYLFILTLLITTSNNCFFWDTIQLGSKHANYFFSTSFSELLLPDNIDSGHIPTFGMYIALIWKLFGQNLVASHLSMLPFVLGILWQLRKLVKKFVPKEYVGLAFLLILIDPTLLSQMTLVSPDIPLVFFFLFGINNLFINRRLLLSISIILLFLISMRGMMVSFCLLIVDLIYNISFSKPLKSLSFSILKRSLIYLPALFVFIAFSLYHYSVKGWIGFHANSPWAESFENVGVKGFLYNIGVLGWRIIDFGRIGIWIVFLILYIKFKIGILKNKQTFSLFLVFLVFLVVLPANMLWAKNLLGHRYLLPIYLVFSLLCANILFTQKLSKITRFLLVSIWLVIELTGNLWVYPEKISQGWDSTLAHLPYYQLRQDCFNYIDKNKINYEDISGGFCLYGNRRYIELMNADLTINTDKKRPYYLYSNISNVDDEFLIELKDDSKWSAIKSFESGFVVIRIYKKK